MKCERKEKHICYSFGNEIVQIHFVFDLFHNTHYRYDGYIRLNEGKGKEEDICGSPRLDAVIRQILF